MDNQLLVPGICGNYQNWSYYQIVLSIESIIKNLGTEEVPNYRIKTTDEVEIIYSQSGVSNLLQRALDPKRLAPIKKFINEQPDAYLNNLTVAIYGGDPEWIPIEMNRESLREQIGDEEFEALNESFGLIKLNGDETLFVLDGQHRLKALRIAYEENKEIAANQLGITLITHIADENGKQKTRRLFSTINRHAKPVSLGENILLDEDDLSAIIVRKLIEDFPLFIGKKLVALNKTADLKMPTDKNKFSSVISLYSINEMLIEAKEVYPKYVGAKSNLVRIRPNDETIENRKNQIFHFWEIFFECFPNAQNFIENAAANPRIGMGPFSLRPIGQQVFCEFYIQMKKSNRLHEVGIIQHIPDDLANEFWHNVLYDPIGQRIIGSKSYAKNYIFYHLNLPLSNKQRTSLLNNYRKYSQNDIIVLPAKLINE